MNYIKTAEADAVPKMPEQSSVVTNVHNGRPPSLKQILQQIWQFCFQFPWQLTVQTGSTDAVTLQNPTGFNQAKGMKNKYYVLVYNYGCCLYVYSQLVKNIF